MMANETRWEHFNHGADIGVRGIGRSREEAFEQTALALMGVIADLENINQDQSLKLCCQGPDDELLLTEWLNVLIYEMAVRKMLFSKFEVNLKGHSLNAQVWGEPVDRARHQPAVEVKGATFTCLKVQKTGTNHWLAQCVVDV